MALKTFDPALQHTRHHLVLRVLATLRAARARVVLVTSAREKEGKTALVELLADTAPGVCAERVEVTCPTRFMEEGGRVSPGTLVLIDGHALLEGERTLMVDPAFWAGIDGALIVASGHATTRQDLQTCRERLDDVGVKALGVVWNEHPHPPVRVLLERFRDLMTRPFRRRLKVRPARSTS